MHRFTHPRTLARQVGFPLFLAVTLAACSGSEDSISQNPNTNNEEEDFFTSLGDATYQTFGDILSVAVTPLRDLNLVNDPIPPILKDAMQAPYKRPDIKRCEALQNEMTQLDLALGGPDTAASLHPDGTQPLKENGFILSDFSFDDLSDLSVEKTAQEAMSQSGQMMHDAAVNFVNAQANIIPVRSVVRMISGADGHDKAMVRAIEAGKLRRAYLRGLAQAKFGARCQFGVTATAKADPLKPVTDIAERLEVAGDL